MAQPTPSGSTATSKPRAQCTLELINLHNTDEFAELLSQRIACGWKKTPADVERWRRESDTQTKALFWIHRLPSADGIVPGVSRAGHISFQSTPDEDGSAEPELVRPDKKLLMISTFFVKPEHREGGLGRAAVQALEKQTLVPPYGSPDCEALTLTCIVRRYTEEEGEDARGMWAKFGLPTPERGRSNEDWYARMGYTKFKEAPRYKETLDDGTVKLLDASFMRKEVQ